MVSSHRDVKRIFSYLLFESLGNGLFGFLARKLDKATARFDTRNRHGTFYRRCIQLTAAKAMSAFSSQKSMDMPR
jgi:hypothetical protein